MNEYLCVFLIGDPDTPHLCYQCGKTREAHDKATRASERMAFADHVYAASEPRVEDRKEQFGEECVYCGKDSWTCEHFKPEDNQ